MENEQMKKAVGKLQEFGKSTFTAENCDKARALSDAFMFKIYRCAKYVMSILAALCLVVAVCSAVFAVLRRSGGMSVPDFDDYKVYFESKSSSDDTKADLSGMKDARQVDKKYGDIIQDCVEKMGVSGDSATKKYESLKKALCRLEEDERGTFIKGLRSFVSDAVSYSKKNENVKQGLQSLDGLYAEEFESAKEIAKERAEEAAATRLAAWSVFGFSLLFLLASLFLPLLLQIEENTRKSAN